MRLVHYLTVMGLAGSLNGQASILEWPVAEGGNGHFYQLFENSSRITWVDANAEAAQQSYLGRPGYLATIGGAAENAWVFSQFIQGTTGVWLGGAQETGGSAWYWANGEPWSYSNWAPGQPDGYLGYPEHTLFYNGNSKWDDAPDAWGNRPSMFLVEYSAVPEPGQVAAMSLILFGMGAWALRRFLARDSAH